MGRCQQESRFRCCILSQHEKACRCHLHFSSCTACVSKPPHSSSSLQSATYISLSISLSFALVFGEDVCRRLGWIRLRCLPLMPKEEKRAQALDGAQLRWERVWMCSRNPCSHSLLSPSRQCSSLVVKMSGSLWSEVILQSSGALYRKAFLGRLHFSLSNKSGVFKLQMQC